MGLIRKPKPVQLFMAVMWAKDAPDEDVLAQLVGVYGKVRFQYGPVPFDFSEYYRDEMGRELVKSYYLFEPAVDRGRLPEIKLHTNDIESTTSRDGKRTVNLDPGYLAGDKLVLATTKDFFHRLYLGDGIFGEVTLHYRHGRFRHFSWTYADYRTPAFLEFLERGRARFVGELRRSAGEKPDPR